MAKSLFFKIVAVFLGATVLQTVEAKEPNAANKSSNENFGAYFSYKYGGAMEAGKAFDFV